MAGTGEGTQSGVQAFAVPPVHAWPSCGPLPLFSRSPAKPSRPWEICVVLAGLGTRRKLPHLWRPGDLQGSGLPVCFSEWTPGGRRSPYTGRARRAFGQSAFRSPASPACRGTAVISARGPLNRHQPGNLFPGARPQRPSEGLPLGSPDSPDQPGPYRKLQGPEQIAAPRSVIMEVQT